MAKLSLSVHMGGPPHPETAVCYCEWGCALPPVPGGALKNLCHSTALKGGRKGLFRVSQNEVTPIAAVRSSLGLLGLQASGCRFTFRHSCLCWECSPTASQANPPPRPTRLGCWQSPLGTCLQESGEEIGHF